MAVRLDAAADRLTHSGSYPTPSSGLTITGWVRIVNDRNDYSCWTRLFDSGLSTAVTSETGSDGTTGMSYFTAGGSVSPSVAMTVGTWYPVAISHNAGTTGKAYVRDGATTVVNSGTVGSATPAGICIGGRDTADATEWFDGEIAYVRVWSAELSQGEIEAEWSSATPVRSSGLHSNWPLANSSDLTDTVGSKTLAVQSGGSLGSASQPSPLAPVFPPPADYTVYACNPDPAYGLTPVVADDTTDNSTALQAALDFVSTNWGGGTVVLQAPDGSGVKLGSGGITIPAKVQLRSDETTLVDATAVTTGPVFVVNDADFTPIVGLRMDGGLFSPTTSDYTSTYAGIEVHGNGLRFEKLHLQYFGRGIDLATSNTWGLWFDGLTIQHCAIGVYLDHETAGTSNSGEEIVIDRFAIANCVRGFWATGGGTDVHFSHGSFDFLSSEVGKINNAVVFTEGCHVETGALTYLYDVTGNTQFYCSDTRFVLGQSILFKAGQGPSNYGFGLARFNNCQAYFTDQSGGAGVAQNVSSEHLVAWAASTTTKDVYVPWPLKWCLMTADFAFNDGNGIPNADKPLIASMSSSTGKLTITSPSNAAARYAKLKF